MIKIALSSILLVLSSSVYAIDVPANVSKAATDAFQGTQSSQGISKAVEQACNAATGAGAPQDVASQATFNVANSQGIAVNVILDAIKQSTLCDTKGVKLPGGSVPKAPIGSSASTAGGGIGTAATIGGGAVVGGVVINNRNSSDNSSSDL